MSKFFILNTGLRTYLQRVILLTELTTRIIWQLHPSETNNLYLKKPDIVKHLEDELKRIQNQRRTRP
jgi:hypothetical protein